MGERVYAVAIEISMPFPFNGATTVSLDYTTFSASQHNTQFTSLDPSMKSPFPKLVFEFEFEFELLKVYIFITFSDFQDVEELKVTITKTLISLYKGIIEVQFPPAK